MQSDSNTIADINADAHQILGDPLLAERMVSNARADQNVKLAREKAKI